MGLSVAVSKFAQTEVCATEDVVKFPTIGYKMEESGTLPRLDLNSEVVVGTWG